MSIYTMEVSKRYLDSNYVIDAKRQKNSVFDAESNLSRWISFVDIFIQLGRVFCLVIAGIFGVSFLSLTLLSFLVSGVFFVFLGMTLVISAKCRIFFLNRARVFLKQGMTGLLFTLPRAVLGRAFFVFFHAAVVFGNIIGVFFPEIGRTIRSVNLVVDAIGQV